MKAATTKILFLVICLITFAYAEPIQNIQAIASSADYKHYHKNHAFDGVVTDKSRWIGSKDENGQIWLELKLPKKMAVKAFALSSGFERRFFVKSFHLEFQNDAGQWQKIDSSVVKNNKSSQCQITLDKAIKAQGFKLVPESVSCL